MDNSNNKNSSKIFVNKKRKRKIGKNKENLEICKEEFFTFQEKLIKKDINYSNRQKNKIFLIEKFPRKIIVENLETIVCQMT